MSWILSLLLIFFLPAAGSCEKDEKDIRSSLYNSKQCVTPKDKFSVYDTIYLLVDIMQLAPGNYTLNTDWVRPDGKVERQTSHDFFLEDKRKHNRFLSWLRLWKLGPLKRMLTGSDFDRGVYGKWQVNVYLNGRRITGHSFTIF